MTYLELAHWIIKELNSEQINADVSVKIDSKFPKIETIEVPDNFPPYLSIEKLKEH